MSNQSKKPDNCLPRTCVWDKAIPSFVQGELQGRDLLLFRDHLASCASCRNQVESTRSLITRMKELTPESAGKDLAPAILARIAETAWTNERQEAPRRSHILPVMRLAAVAASILAVLGLGIILYKVTPAPEEQNAAPAVASGAGAPSGAEKPELYREVMLALEWLAAAQEEDGSWDPARWDGRPQFEVGLSGLSLLAFLNSGESGNNGRFAAVTEKGLHFLLRQQDTQGRFGPEFSGTLYNHGLASMALMEAYAAGRDPSLKPAIGRALEFITSSQCDEGGWSGAGTPGRPDPSVTAWQIQVLMLAGSLDWPQARQPAGKGMKWLAAGLQAEPAPPPDISPAAAFHLFIRSTGGSPGGQDTPAASAFRREMDLHRYYYLTHAIHMAGSIKRGTPVTGRVQVAGLNTGTAHTQLAQLNRALIDGQLKTGANAGSWEPTGQWGTAGGRVYSTAMAALSLEAGPRSRRLLDWTGTSPR